MKAKMEMDGAQNRIGFTLLALLTSITAHAQAPAPIKAPTITTPTVTSPTVTNPTVQRAQAPAPANGVAAAPTQQAGTRAALVVTAYDEATFKTAAATGQPIVLLFSAANDPVWTAQAAALQNVLRDPEFAQKVPAYQIDMTTAEVVTAYGVKAAGTILIMKDGVERMRSTRMTKPDVIKKMLRLRSVL